MNEQLAYFQIQVLTASPPKLRLLLIEAALQLARQSLRAQEEAQAEPAFQGLHRLRKVILQLLTSLEDHDGGLGHTFQRVYLLLYRTVTEAQLSGNTQKTRDIVRILEVERKTWQELTERFVTESAKRGSAQPECADPAATRRLATPTGSSLCLQA